ncbi:SpoIID/LytB domain-containing protein [Piscibacillus halophilus]|uniref:Stage II sporulation protein D n=1 Tax=Piscibacillus halophilus TaxID=571933 RepID=A0A1H9I2M7_9BACI|nr:SpoIID/LytB domain-containing protein [Piscibacillus halophilus]SEQ68813.1 stage II sporulation protein D [Piscibacillus halophilus]
MKALLKSMIFLSIVSALLTISLLTVSADQQETNIRIGVVPTSESINVGSEGDFTVYNKETGEVLFTGTNSSVEATLVSTGEVQTNYRLQTAWTTSETAKNEWVELAESEGYATYTEEYNGGWRLYIGEFSVDAPWGERDAFRTEVIEKGLAGSDSFWKIVTINEGASAIQLDYNGETVTTEDHVVLESDQGIVSIDGERYRGVAEIGFNSSNTLAGINELPIEEYLKGVVPHELPPVPYGEMEAQKSQAVAARTYSFANLGKRSSDGYDLLPTTSDQVYGGYDAEHPISSQAVDETKGVVATHDGELITAVYHSTSGGHTANNEDVWNSDPVPYLRGVPDSQRGKAFEHVPTLEVFKNSANPTSLRASKNGDFESDWSRYHRWNFEWSPEEISQVLSGYYDTDVGEVYEINVLERSSSGRVYEIEYVTENGTFYEYKDRIRWSLPYINADGNESVLLSTLFFIEPVEYDDGSVGFKAYGGGWGHGVGLAQTGAVGMAEKGKNYEEILKHYYQGIDLETLY